MKNSELEMLNVVYLPKVNAFPLKRMTYVLNIYSSFMKIDTLALIATFDIFPFRIDKMPG